MSIRKIKARKVFDQAARPTLEVDLITEVGLFRTSVPNDPNDNPFGLQQLRDNAVDIVNDVIGPELVKSGLKVNNQKDIDRVLVQLDGTDDKSVLGTVAMFAVSSGCCKAGALEKQLPLYKYISSKADCKSPVMPVPAFSIINGGRSSNNPLLFQDFLVLPVGAKSFEEAFDMGNAVYRAVEAKLAEMDEAKPPLLTNDRGAFVPQNLEDDGAAVQTLQDAITGLGYTDQVKLQVNINASSFGSEGNYNLSYKESDTPDDYSTPPEELVEMYKDLKTRFPSLISLEDPFHMDDWDSWALLMDGSMQIVCTELGAMRSDRIQEALDQRSANCLTLEPWRVGTITESLAIAKLASNNDWEICVGAGFVGTEDHFIVDFALGLSCGIFRAGAPIKSSKYNQMIRLERGLQGSVTYAGERIAKIGT